ncbi:hypothetical protein HXX76_009819 [Chlamydomonas incerta]|uniref:3CxxC-type domain-containing protein n=1 Tax=Chlamydomonas incerta TaxID=51695 RepID=A0A835T1Q1_CHLIN|nr:hypothetical protein HXX76_009819 [Chlamydomonas incerta]|eukprot:KAG2430845.1 hypothetical protein HXX76_009819 [Chlamydomonas incerta]
MASLTAASRRVSAVPRRPLAGQLLRPKSVINIVASARRGPSGLTPYQGHERMFGKFRCTSCGRRWQSGNSWANKGQMCKRCDILVYPYSQEPLEKLEDDDRIIDPNKPHPQELCQMCQELGYPCTSKRVWVPDVDDSDDDHGGGDDDSDEDE